ncbi:fun14 family protein [Rutstroemia sp. NJR-2017a WRK4]|nr:fun14 family protein [Rutstroemia sp. NJR-2017a BBW]PQE30764.1 fun14 family protein [Rutstroemia sp. NJR-2017a WRK4]
MSRLLLRPQALGLGIGASISTYHLLHQRPMRCDSGSVLSGTSYQRNAAVPVTTRDGGLNPKAVRQISSGSIIGLCTGLAVSTFSRSLALVIGLLVVGVQWASSYGINLLPYERVQRYVKGVDLRSAIQDNVAFKVSFGTTFAMAAFMHF